VNNDLTKQLFPEAIRLMRARHKLDSFIAQIVVRETNDAAGKKYLKDLSDELLWIEMDLYKPKKNEF